MWDMAPRPGSPKGYLWHNTKLQGVKAYLVAADDNSFCVGIRHNYPSGTIVSHDINNGNVEWIKYFDSALTTRAAFVDNFLLISNQIRSSTLHRQIFRGIAVGSCDRKYVRICSSLRYKWNCCL